jgi:dipeptidyl aminopeptidase/acylaminoacyl peptidase
MIVAVLALAAVAASPLPRAVFPDDVYRLQSVIALEISPDGRRIAYTIEIADRETDGFRDEVWIANAEGDDARRLCRAEDNCSSPKFSPDGSRLAYLSDRKNGTQIWVARSGRGSGEAVTDVDESIGAFDWSPDGTRIVFEKDDAYVRKRPPGATAAGTRGEDADAPVEREDDSAPYVIRRTQIQMDGVGFLEDRYTHLWVVTIEGRKTRQITRGSQDDAAPRWSPKGDWIAFVSNRHTDPDVTDDTDIYLVRPEGGPIKLLASNPGPDEAPVWSHAGDRVAFVGAMQPNDYYQTTRLMVVPVEGGPACDLSGTFDNWVSRDNTAAGSSRAGRILWTEDDETLIVPFDRRGANWVAAIPSAGGEPKEILGGAKVHGLVRRARGSGRLYYTLSTPTTYSELWTSGADGSGAKALIRPNASLFATWKLSTPTRVLARNSANDAIDAWLYPPLDLDAAKRYPLVLYVHGGPQEYDGEFFDAGLENQIFPGKGWGVLRVNYRGSTSYGQAFSRVIRSDWHSREHEDLMAALDAAIAGHRWIDPERLGIGGWSYGGIMTIWAVGHTDRFKVGVPERFEVDYLSCFGTDQWHTQYVTEMGKPWENEQLYRNLSPGSYLTRIKTPLYLIANENDGNCPPTQAMQLYQRLKLMGINTELVIYPDEHHTMSLPSHYVDRLYRLVDWFGRHLRGP